MIDIRVQAKVAPKDAIVRLLQGKQYGASILEISKELDISRPTVSKYCNILSTQGMIYRKKLGKNVIYTKEPLVTK